MEKASETLERVAQKMSLHVEMERLGVTDLSATTHDARAEIQGRVVAHWRGLVPLARAAIEALREPTEEMKLAGRQADPMLDSLSVEDCEAEACAYRAMIDAVLSPSHEAP